MGLRTLKTDVVSAIDDVYNNINGGSHDLHNFSMDRGCSVHVTNQNRVVPDRAVLRVNVDATKLENSA